MQVTMKIEPDHVLEDAIDTLASSEMRLARDLLVLQAGLKQAREIMRALSAPGATLSAQDIAHLREILL